MISSETLFDIDRLDRVVNLFIDDSYVDNACRPATWSRLGQSPAGCQRQAHHVRDGAHHRNRRRRRQRGPNRRRRALFDAIIDDEPLPGRTTQRDLTPMTASRRTTKPPTPAAIGDGLLRDNHHDQLRRKHP